MGNGRPGDHPIHDILHHRVTVYSEEIDAQIIEISNKLKPWDLYSWWTKSLARESDLDRIKAIVSEKSAQLKLISSLSE